MCLAVVRRCGHAEVRERARQTDEVRRRDGTEERCVDVDCETLEKEARPCRCNLDCSLVRLLSASDIGIADDLTGAPIYFDCCVPTSDLRKEICLAWIEVIIMNKNKSELGQDLPLEE